MTRLLRYLFVAVCLFSLYLWYKLTAPDSPFPPAWPWDDYDRLMMDVNAIERRRKGWITVEERVS